MSVSIAYSNIKKKETNSVSHPFFIWTMRRTGGTTLTDMLMELSEHPKTDHEPFLLGRSLGSITQDYIDGNIGQVRSALREVFGKKTLIKHCYEILGEEFNDLLMKELLEFPDYRHILLLRRDETSRMLSLMLALQTDVWGKHGSEWVYQQIRSGKRALEPFDLERLKSEEDAAIARTRHLKALFNENKIDLEVIYYEDLYREGERKDRMMRLRRLLALLEIDIETFRSKREWIRHMMFDRSQRSHSVLGYVPNFEEAREILDRFPDREVITGD